MIDCHHPTAVVVAAPLSSSSRRFSAMDRYHNTYTFQQSPEDLATGPIVTILCAGFRARLASRPAGFLGECAAVAKMVGWWIVTRASCRFFSS